MNLEKLFEAQRKLDEHIEREHPRQHGEDRLVKKILALLVELGELANEHRSFKYWSNNQKPRTLIRFECDRCGGTGIGTDFLKNCSDCKGSGKTKTNPLLEEFADGLHFLLSTGLESDVGTFTGNELTPVKMESIEMQFISLFEAVSRFIYDVNYYPVMWELFLGLGEMLGFTWEQVEEAYFQKNAVNHWRQDNAY